MANQENLLNGVSWNIGLISDEEGDDEAPYLRIVLINRGNNITYNQFF